MKESTVKTEQDYTYIKSNHQRSSLSTQLQNIPALVWLILVIFGLSFLGLFGLILSWVLIALWVLRGTDEAIEGLLMSLLLSAMNPELTSSVELASFARWLILFEATARVTYEWIRRKPKSPPWLKYLLVFVLYVSLVSFFVSWWPMVSFLKLATFTTVVLTTYFGIKLGHKDWIRNLIALGATISLLSLPLIFYSIGYVRNGYQFQGILNHPQSYGVIIGMTMAAAIGCFLMDKDIKLSLYHFVILASMGVTMILSVSRTGYFALILAVLVPLFLWKDLTRMFARLIFNPFTYFAIAILVVVVWIAPPIEVFQKYFFERDVNVYTVYELPIDAENSVLNQLIASRSKFAAQSWQNFLRSPVIGVGFGLPSIRIPREVVSTIAGLPVGLPYQKGFIGTAVLEEVGVVGVGLLLLLIISQLQQIFSARAVVPLMLYLVVLFINFGEFSYFSTGGIGLLEHILIATALVTSERLKTQIIG